jgi:hypothetical protein
MIWEYVVIRIDGSDLAWREETLNRWGADGWELASVETEDDDWVVYTFKISRSKSE